LAILNYMVTSNHVHLLVVDTGKRDVIPKSMQLVARRTGQEYNQRKNRRGAYWEDRYHVTAAESGEHLARCMVYIDTNMIRTGVVSHPSLWSFSGYNEIQDPRRKNILIDDERLRLLIGSGTYEKLRSSHRGWVEEYLGSGAQDRQEEWTDSIAVGSKSFIEKVKSLLGCKAKGRDITKGGEGYHLREEAAPYAALFRGEKDDIGSENAYLWDTNIE
jgi:putative transposase